MSSTHNPGRVAGFLYLLLVVFAPFRLIYIPSTLFVRGNAIATANNIVAHELLFRLGIVSDLFCGIILIFLALALYRLGIREKTLQIRLSRLKNENRYRSKNSRVDPSQPRAA